MACLGQGALSANQSKEIASSAEEVSRVKIPCRLFRIADLCKMNCMHLQKQRLTGLPKEFEKALASFQNPNLRALTGTNAPRQKSLALAQKPRHEESKGEIFLVLPIGRCNNQLQQLAVPCCSQSFGEHNFFQAFGVFR